MKTFAIAAVLALTASSALAQGFEGIYIGLNAGQRTTENDFKYNNIGTNADQESDDGVWGAMAGFMRQFGGWVTGVEADMNFNDVKSSVRCPNSTYHCETEVRNQASLRGRLGYDMGGVMPYVTGGVAIADVDAHTVDTGGNHFGGSNTHTGWVAGGGVEAFVRQNVLARVEVLHTDLGEKNYNVDNGLNADVRPKGTTIRGGLSVLF